MATLLVKVASSMTLDGAQALIMGQHSYLEFVRSFPSFRTIQFTAPSEDQSSIDAIRSLAYVHGATYDKEYKIDPVEGGETAVAEWETDTLEDNTSEISGQRNTRIITSSGGGTIYVKVANYLGIRDSSSHHLRVVYTVVSQPTVDLYKVVHILLTRVIPLTQDID